VTEEKETMRMLELRHWLRHTVKACPMCALRLAIIGVEKEAGRSPDLPALCLGDGTCAGKAREAWAGRPRRAT
jgi:hypothetical protein